MESEVNPVEETGDMSLITGRKRTLSTEPMNPKKHRTSVESETPTPLEEMTPMMRAASLCRDTLASKLLHGVAYGLQANTVGAETIDELELSSAQCLLLALLRALVAGDLMSSILLADLCHSVQRLCPRILEDFDFPVTDMENALALLTKLVADATLKLPAQVMTIMVSLAKKYKIDGVQLRTLTKEGNRELAIQLENAVVNNSARDIFELESEGADICGLTQSGDSLLHLAVRAGCSASITALCILNADLDVENSSKSTPLEEAVRSNCGSSVKYLLKAGANVAKRSVRGDTYLHTAAKGYNEALEALLEKGMNANEKNYNGETALVEAIRAGNVRGIELLLKNGVDASNILSVKLKEGDSIIHSMARSGDTHVLKLLRDRGITANIRNLNGVTPLHVACNVSVMRVLLRMGADVNSVDKTGSTVLMRAARNNQTDIISLLLLSRADPNVVNNEHQTALHYAVEEGFTETVSTLLEAGARVYNDCDWSYWYTSRNANKWKVTPFGIAAVKNKPEILKLLVEKGDLSVRDSIGNGILHYEAYHGHVEVVKALLDAGVPVDMKGDHQFTALHLAVKSGQTAVVKALLAAGAAVDIKGYDQKTALHMAVKNNMTEIVTALLDAGASVYER